MQTSSKIMAAIVLGSAAQVTSVFAQDVMGDTEDKCEDGLFRFEC